MKFGIVVMKMIAVIRAQMYSPVLTASSTMDTMQYRHTNQQSLTSYKVVMATE